MLIMKGEDSVGGVAQKDVDLYAISSDCFCVFKNFQSNKISF